MHANELYVSTKTENLKKIGDFITDLVKETQLEPDKLDDVLIATDEAATNIILHGYHRNPGGYIRLKAEIGNDKIVISLFNNGEKFDPDCIKRPYLGKNFDKRQIGGVGIFLMKKFMDKVEFFFKHNGNDENEIRMTKYI